jgi:hypothetical protein
VDPLDRMCEVERFVGKLTKFLDENGVRLKVDRKSDHRLTGEDEIATLVFDDGIELRVTEHCPGFMETFMWLRDRPEQPQGSRITGSYPKKKRRKAVKK